MPKRAAESLPNITKTKETFRMKKITYLVIAVLLSTLLSITVFGELKVFGGFKEDIIRFNNQNVQVVNIGGHWKVTSGNMWLLDFGTNQDQANQALQVIKSYHLNEQCFVGRPNPPMQYFLADDTAPSGPLPGEDSIRFDNNNLRVLKIDNRWKVVEGGNHYMLDFDQNEAGARAALRIIRKYDFNYICFVGRPHPPMMYFRR
jgi:hypothetical protein